MIAECDPYYGKYDANGGYIKIHHVGMVPWKILGTSCMNQTNTTEGGFKGSYMYNTTLPKYLAGYKSAYGSGHFLTFGNYITTRISSTAPAPGCTSWTGVANMWEWYQTQITLLTEVQVYGSRVWGGGYDVGEGNSQLAAFRFNQQVRNFNIERCWLRAVASSADFAVAGYSGNASTWVASGLAYVRPLLLLY